MKPCPPELESANIQCNAHSLEFGQLTKPKPQQTTNRLKQLSGRQYLEFPFFYFPFPFNDPDK
jgi:hypothetical protein